MAYFKICTYTVVVIVEHASIWVQLIDVFVVAIMFHVTHTDFAISLEINEINLHVYLWNHNVLQFPSRQGNNWFPLRCHIHLCYPFGALFRSMEVIAFQFNIITKKSGSYCWIIYIRCDSDNAPTSRNKSRLLCSYILTMWISNIVSLWAITDTRIEPVTRQVG